MTYWTTSAMLRMLVSPVSSSMPVKVSASLAGRANPTPIFITLVVLRTSTWSTGQGSR